MIRNAILPPATYSKIDELLRIGSSAVAKAQEDSRRKGVPNVYSINGRLYYETPTGELSTRDPYTGGQAGPEQNDAPERE